MLLVSLPRLGLDTLDLLTTSDVTTFLRLCLFTITNSPSCPTHASVERLLWMYMMCWCWSVRKMVTICNVEVESLGPISGSGNRRQSIHQHTQEDITQVVLQNRYMMVFQSIP